ncbi:MAG: hypothetical protein F6K30_03025 [Cyanothece sp. SIO2G6]|nr:hypothetical protein [Cyanothece sp. SIO2G6]
MITIPTFPFEVMTHHTSLNLLYGKSAIARLMGYAVEKSKTIQVWSEKGIQVILERKICLFLSRKKLDTHFYAWHWEPDFSC